jgi:replicative DNA helicase
VTTSLHEAIGKQTGVVQERVDKGGVSFIGIRSGFDKVDRSLLGFRNDQLYILAGRPSMGKTACALSMSLNIAHEGHRVLFISLEMDASLLSTRVLSSRTGIPAESIELGRLNEQQMMRVNHAIDPRDSFFTIADDSMTSRDVYDLINGMEEKPEFIVVDYISLLRDNGDLGQTERITKISGNLREIARLCDAPVRALAQLNREVEKRENHMPILSDLRDSGALEQDAFAVLLVYRPHYYEMMFGDGQEELEVERDAKIIIAKNRQGVTGATTAWYTPKTMTWTQKDSGIVHPSPRGAR